MQTSKQFIVVAYDAKDEGAYERRLTVRQAHVASITQLREEGKILCGIAITDDNEKMIGSVVVTNFPSRDEFDAWLAKEPYVIGKVWENITVLNGQIGPSFADLIKKA
jgi:uncharacterized protein YciI